MAERSGSEASVRWQAKMSASKASLACRPRFRTLVTVSLLVEHLADSEDWAAGVTLDAGAYALRAARICGGVTGGVSLSLDGG